LSYAEELDSYNAYLNSLQKAREHYAPAELEKYEADLLKAKAAMERAWLEELAAK
jgi:hypothetical protein